MGQSELHDMLGRHDLRQLAQRVTARYHLSALTLEETQAYIRHRLLVADGVNVTLPSPPATVRRCRMYSATSSALSGARW